MGRGGGGGIKEGGGEGKNKGIFRSVQQKENENVPDSIPESAKLFFHNFD